MASSLQVLCPNGRRQNVQINPNTKLLQILEEVCQRQGFIPPEDYRLVQSQSRKELDLSLSVRFSSLPNNAKLELVKCASTRVEQDVTIALQLESGERLQDSFKPSANLWDILLHMEDKNRDYKKRLTHVDENQTPALHPVCIFMREEIIGESALKATTLKKLGLTSGKAIIRLLHRPVEDRVLSEIASTIEKEKQKQTKLDEIALKKHEMRLLDEMERNRKSGDDVLDDVKEETADCSPMETSQTQDSPYFVDVDSRSGMDNSSVHDVSVTAPESPGKSRFKQKPAQDDHSFGHSLEQSSSVDTFPDPSDFQDLSPQQQAIAQRLMQRFLPGLQEDSDVGSTSTRNNQPQGLATPFTEFKFPVETKGMDLTGSSRETNAENISQACDREYLVFNTEEPLPFVSESSDTIPDEFFEVTQADVRIMYRDLQNAVRQMEDQPLMTSAMRQSQSEAQFDHYERIVIRIQFPDRLTLQGLFRPRESVASLYAFVKEHLSDPKLGFYLYTAPPKEILRDRKSSLAACHLAPAALVYCSSESQKDHLLNEQARSKICHRLEAEAQVYRVLHSAVEADSMSSPPSNSFENTPASSSQSGAPRVTRRIDYASGTTAGSSSSQVPKWLKLSKK